MLVRAFGGVARTLWVVGTGERVAYVTTAAELPRLIAGEAVPMVGIPFADLFEWNEQVVDGAAPDWGTQPRWRGLPQLIN